MTGAVERMAPLALGQLFVVDEGAGPCEAALFEEMERLDAARDPDAVADFAPGSGSMASTSRRTGCRRLAVPPR
jgi:hypothetical protein